MGCGKVSKPGQSIWINAFSGMFRYRVKVFFSDTKEIQEYIHEDQFDEMPVTALMNILAFSEKDSVRFDANFISAYDKVLDKFEYSVQRLVGIEKNLETRKEWILSINKVKYSWDQICQDNLRIKPQDSIIWMLQDGKV